MPDYILVQDAQGQWQRAAETDLPDEKALQKLIREHPETLPLDDLGDDIPPLLIVGRETALATGYADVVGLDPDGLVTVIECKLDRNPEVKRGVVAQVLGYAASLWGLTYEQFETLVARKYFDSPTCHRPDLRGMALDDAVARFRDEQALGGEWDKSAFREQLADNLKRGRFRLVIVVDKVNDELRRAVEFLNACTGPAFDILCAELRYYATDRAKLLVPALIGKPISSKTQSGVSVGQTWTEERFFVTLREKHGQEAEQTARRLLAWCKKHADQVLWGAGTRSGSFSGLVLWDPEHIANVFVVWTYGQVELGFAYIRPYPPFNEEAKRRELLEQVNQIKDVALPNDAHNRRPSIPLMTLAGEVEFRQFTAIIQAAIDELRAARDKPSA
ncbi:MAG: hypothetical protein L0387_19915 [Acidobacteria bacterium]|nr:hypothetical protein [Acidobacteriota bacterium]